MGVSPRVFGEKKTTRCFTCKHVELSNWIGECLIRTRKSGERKPSAERIYSECTFSFPEETRMHINSMRRHLIYHEPEWYDWETEDP